MQPRLAILLCLLVGSSLACSREGTHVRSTGSVRVVVDARTRHQSIDGFGTTGPSRGGELDWLRALYYDDLGASMLRIDLTPAFKSPYADHAYNSPWFHGSPGLPGPEGNNVRSYRDAADYGRAWAGQRAPIAVMGPHIEHNLTYFDYAEPRVKSFGDLAAHGTHSHGSELKLIASLWSPAPWLKKRSGGSIHGQSGVLPKDGARWPFIWAGNFAGGTLDTSGKPVAEFDDRPLGGQGPTSALTQFARGLAAYVLGFQRTYGVRFDAISIQNELGFETFYNSCSYPRTSDYIAALKAARAELDRHPELRSIRLMGPEDLLGSSGYGLWEFGGESSSAPKNLQFLDAVAKDPEASKALALFCVHGYAADGVTGTGADPKSWRMWAHGWKESPERGLPSAVRGFASYGKKSWLTETSGEPSIWAPASEGTLADSALGLAVKIHQALTAGEESAWVYWQLLDDDPVNANTLTDRTLRARAPKYTAAKHFFRFIRPGAVRIDARTGEPGPLLASAYLHEAQRTLTVVLVQPGKSAQAVQVAGLTGARSVEAYGSRAGQLWHAQPAALKGDVVALELPAESIVTLVAHLP